MFYKGLKWEVQQHLQYLSVSMVSPLLSCITDNWLKGKPIKLCTATLCFCPPIWYPDNFGLCSSTIGQSTGLYSWATPTGYQCWSLLGSCYGSIVTDLLTSCRGHEMGQDMATRSFDQGQIAMGLMMWAGGTIMYFLTLWPTSFAPQDGQSLKGSDTVQAGPYTAIHNHVLGKGGGEVQCWTSTQGSVVANLVCLKAWLLFHKYWQRVSWVLVLSSHTVSPVFWGMAPWTWDPQMMLDRNPGGPCGGCS